MGATADTIISEKILEVLNKIDEKLERLDQRLQVSQPREQSLQDRHDDSEEGEQSEIEIEHRYSSFNIKRVGGKLVEVEITDNDLLNVFERLSCPCPHIPEFEKKRLARKHVYPFYQLCSLCVSAERIMSPKDEYFKLRQDVFLSGRLDDCVQEKIAELVECLCIWDSNVENLNLERSDIDQAELVRFDQLPSLFTPGTLLMGRGQLGREQYAAVSMCELVSGYSESDTCRVDYWHFKWAEKGLCRVCESFEVSQYPGTRHISQLLWRPLIYPLSGESIQKAVDRGKKSLSVLRSFPITDYGDYPLLMYDGSLAGEENDTVS